MNKNKFEDRRPDGDNEIVTTSTEDNDKKSYWNIGKWSMFVALVIISLTASITLICSGIHEMPMEQQEISINEQKHDDEPEATPRVAKPETDFVGLSQHYASYKIRRQSGDGKNDGDKITLQIFQNDGSCTVEDYVSSGGHWLPIDIKEFRSSEEAENYLVGQNNGPMAAPE